ncbi:hypothetical protein BH11PSE10_BH11PSE10_21830 [soil metagenome]
MLTLSEDQLTTFADLRLAAFVRDALAHLQEFFPQVLERAGAVRAEALLHSVIARAGEYGVTSAQDICILLDLVVIFGWDFDRSQPWASEVLLGAGYGDPSTRIDLLFAAGLRQIDANPPPEPSLS